MVEIAKIENKGLEKYYIFATFNLGNIISI